MNKVYNIDRKTAARLLNVSLRTIDRYLATEKLNHIKSRGRVWLSKDEIVKLYNELNNVKTDSVSGSLWQDDKTDNDTTAVENETDKVYYAETKSKSEKANFSQNDDSELPFYKSLYYETKTKLEQASIKISQLEAQLATMVPMLEFQRQQKVLQENNNTHKQKVFELEQRNKTESVKLLAKIHEKESLLSEKDKEIDTERFNKAIFAVILFFILFLQPILWMILR
jgi:hypothetical protein